MVSRNLPIDGDGDLFHRDLLPRSFEGPIDHISDSPAARDFHADNGYRVDWMAGEEVREFGDVPVNICVEFRAEDDHDFITQEIPVEARIRKGSAVR